MINQYGILNFMHLNHWAPWNWYFLPEHLPNLPGVSCLFLGYSCQLQLESQAENAASDAAFARRPLEVALETAVEDGGMNAGVLGGYGLHSIIVLIRSWYIIHVYPAGPKCISIEFSARGWRSDTQKLFATFFTLLGHCWWGKDEKVGGEIVLQV